MHPLNVSEGVLILSVSDNLQILIADAKVHELAHRFLCFDNIIQGTYKTANIGGLVIIGTILFRALKLNGYDITVSSDCVDGGRSEVADHDN